MFKPIRCTKSAGQTRTSIYGYILPCKHLVCIPCYDSCITPTGGRHLGTIHTGTCPTGTCYANFRSTNARKWSPIELNEQRMCGSVIGELVELTSAGVGRVNSPEPESGNNEEGEEAESSQQSTSLFTTASDADNAERVKFIQDAVEEDEDEDQGQSVEVESTWSEPGSGYTTPRNETFLDMTHSSPLIISSSQSSPGNVNASVKSSTSTRRRHSESIASPSKSAKRRRTTSNENQGPVPLERVLEAIKSKKPKRSRSQLSDVTNDGGEANRQRLWRSDEHVSFSSQEKNEAHDEVYGYEARAQAKLERGDSDDEEEYAIHSSSPADVGEYR